MHLLLFPHQLFGTFPAPLAKRMTESELNIHLIEEPLFFNQFRFHKQKIVFHRASMKAYAQKLKIKGATIHYHECHEANDEDLKKITGPIHCIEVSDDWLKQKLKRCFSDITWYKSSLFCSQTPLKKMKHYRMASFYQKQRKDLNILIDEHQKPIGGKWSFDADNRKKIPKGTSLPTIKEFHSKTSKKHIDEAKTYAKKHFNNHYGEIKNFITPITHEDAEKWLNTFLKERFQDFGQYEDAIKKGESFLFHSVLSPLINIGLLSPMQVVNAALKIAKESNDQLNEIPLNSLEGFIRQIIGWREFIHEVYHLEGRKQRTSNFFKHTRRIPESFWHGTTGIEPVDDVIQKLNKTGYSHHIERLMILSNFMTLCEFEPNQIYEWFMTLYIDAYDWVMVPNVYGMSLYADGGLMTTKPYISSSNYIRKMSDHSKGEWCEIWDALYWRFIHKHKEFFAGNPRLSVMTLALKRMSKEKLAKHLKIAENFLKRLD